MFAPSLVLGLAASNSVYSAVQPANGPFDMPLWTGIGMLAIQALLASAARLAKIDRRNRNIDTSPAKS